MSAVGQPSVPRSVGPKPSATGAAFGALGARLRAFVADTPGRMRALRLLAVGASLIFAVGASSAAWAQRDALRNVSANAAQQTRLGVIRTSIVESDAVATNSFLTDGLEAPGTRTAYEAAMKRGSVALADAAARDKADRELLGEVNADLVRYSGLIESARATNRQGLPVGVAYVKQASGIARDEILPKLTKISQRHASAVDTQFSHFAGVVIALRVSALVGIGVLLGVSVWLGLRTRRTVNIGYAIAAGLLVLISAAAAVALQKAQSNAATTYRSDYAETLTLLQARANAFEAKSAESLTLISRGSGSVFDERYDQLKNDALVQLDVSSNGSTSTRTVDRTAARTAFLEFDGIHIKVRDFDRLGNWDDAVGLVTSTGSGSAAQAFATFERANQRSIDRAAAAVTNDISSHTDVSNYAAWMLLVGGLLAALLSIIGMSARLREYS